jgi:hypothetical protein
MHLGRCPCLTAIFGTINKAVGFVPTQNITVQQKTLNILFGHPHKDTPPLHDSLEIYHHRLLPASIQLSDAPL